MSARMRLRRADGRRWWERLGFVHERLNAIDPGPSHDAGPFEPQLLHPAYVAGIIDGEGSVFTRKRNPHVSVSSTTPELIASLGLFGGHGLKGRPPNGLGTKPAWDWIITGESAAIVLRACIPYMLIKRDKAVRALDEFSAVAGSNHGAFARKARRKFAELGWPQCFEAQTTFGMAPWPLAQRRDLHCEISSNDEAGSRP